MLTGIINTKNEEDNISDAIDDLSFCDEIIVCDNGSSDNTVQISRKKGVQVVTVNFSSYSKQRNIALKKARGDWVFFLDADERVSSELRDEILAIIKDPDVTGVHFRRSDYFLGKKMNFGETAFVRLLRLAKKDAGKWKREVHEFWDVKGKTKVAKRSIDHFSHPDLHSFIKKVTRYSKLHALENKNEGKKGSIIKVLMFPVMKFKKNYLIKLGFCDGVHGFVFAVLMSFHSFLSWSTLWLSVKKGRSIR